MSIWLLVMCAALAQDLDEALGDLDGELPDGIALPDGPVGIVNGTVAVAGDFPNVVSLAMEQGGLQTFCSGSLIHPEWVLTAAHCIDGLPDAPVFVLFGEDATGGNHRRLVETVDRIAYENYNPAQFIHDIGLFQLAEPVNDIDLMLVNDEPLSDGWIGRELTFAGFGITVDNGNDAGIKRYAEIPISGFDGNNIFAADPDQNVCNGDSGGPSMQFVERGWAQQVGVNAYVTPGCVGGESGSTDVSSYLDFLDQHVPELLHQAPSPLEDGGPGELGALDFGANEAKNGPGVGLRFGEKRRGYGPRPPACQAAPGQGMPAMAAWLALGAAMLVRRRRDGTTAQPGVARRQNHL